MNTYYNVKVKGNKEDQESGKIIKVSDSYLCSAVSFTDAETIATELATARLNDFDINSITKTKVSEIINKDAEKWYQCKVNFIDIDEKNGKEVKRPVIYIVGGDTVGNVHKTLEEFLKTSLEDNVIERIDETSLVEISE